MTTGTIKLYRIPDSNGHSAIAERVRYYSVKERKNIIRHWWRKYNGQINNHYIQIAPGVDLTGKFLTHKIESNAN